MTSAKSRTDAAALDGLLDRLLASHQLKRSARLREFLSYIWRRTLEENCDQIHEQEIGTQVFLRVAGYDTSADNIVRVSATDLRKRIESYFSHEGIHEPIVVEMPRGNYKLLFRAREEEKSTLTPPLEQASVLPELPLQNRPLRRYQFLFASAAVLIVVLFGCCMTLYLQNRELRRSLYAWKSMPTMRSFWSEIIDASQKTDIVLADPSFALIEDITNQKIPLSDFLSHSYLEHLHDASLSADRQQDLDKISSRNFGSLGDFHVATRLVALDPGAQKMGIFYARNYSADQIKVNNVILIGSRKSNPWVDLYEGRMNFVMQYDIHLSITKIENRKPLAGESSYYVAPGGSEPVTGYAVIAYLPNLRPKGKVLLIEGSSSEATAAAGDFLTSEDQLRSLEKFLHVNHLPFFEVLLKTSHVSGTPISSEIVAAHLCNFNQHS